MVRNPRLESDRVNETSFVKLVNFLFNHFLFRGIEMTLIFPNRVGISECVNVVLHNSSTNSYNFLVIP